MPRIKLRRKMKIREGSGKWHDKSLIELTDAGDSSDEPAGSISSEDSDGCGADFRERLRSTPSRYIWTYEEILNSLYQLPGANEVAALINIHVESLSATMLPTALLWTCWLGRSTILSKLLKINQHLVDYTDNMGRTGLHISALVGSEDCVRVLLEHGADPKRWDHTIMATPLHCAASAKSVGCIKILLGYGADVNAGLTNSHTPLHYAVLSDALDCVSELIHSGAIPDTPQVFTETPLHIAADLGSASCLKILLDAGADVRSQLGPSRNTALHLAAEDGHAECAQLLIDKGAMIDCVNYRRQTPLHLAALAQSPEVAQLLVDKGASVGARDSDGRTPLHGAIVKGSRTCDVARILLEAGANPNRPDNFGYTPMHIAALNEFSSCVCLLLDYGGDVTLRTNGGISVLNYIVRRTPDVIPAYIKKFNDSIILNEQDIGDVDCELKLDFRALVPCLARGETELMLAFIEVGRKDILKHPLCETFLFLKWRKIRKYFIASLVYHSIYIMLFSIYVLSVFVCNTHVCQIKENKAYVMPIGLIVIILNTLILAKEGFQARNNIVTYYSQWENWLQCIIIIGVFICTLPNNAGRIGSQTYIWQHDTAAITAFLCWSELMMLIGRFPMFGLYVQMFTTVTINFATFLMAYSCLLVAFGLAFSILFANYKSFHNLWVGLVKTMIMMSGELEYEDMFYRDFDEGSESIFSINDLLKCTFKADRGINGTIAQDILSCKFLENGGFKCLFNANHGEHSFGINDVLDCLFTSKPNFNSSISASKDSFNFTLDTLVNGTSQMQTFQPIQYPFTAHVLFIVFVLIVTVILTNLLVGLAVSDIQALQESAGLDRLVRQAQLVAHLESMLFSPLLNKVPRTLTTALRRGALLTSSTYRTALCIRPNDPRENRIPKDLITSTVKVAAEKKDNRYDKNRSFRFSMKNQNNSEKLKTNMYRRSYLYETYSNSEVNNVERRRKTTSTTPDTNYSTTFQDVLLTDVRNQLSSMNKKLDSLTRVDSINQKK